MKFQHKHPAQRARQRGITLVEMGMALLIVGGALLGGFALYQKINREVVLDRVRKDVTVIVSGISKAMIGVPSTDGMNTQIMSTMNIWPKERVTDAGKTMVSVAGPFAGSTERVFAYADARPPRLPVGNQAFNYWIENVPQEYCADLVQMLAAQNAVLNIGVGSMGGTMVSTGSQTQPASTLTAVTPSATSNAGRRWVMNELKFNSELNMSEVTAGCSEEPTGSTNNKRQINVIVVRGSPV